MNRNQKEKSTQTRAHKKERGQALLEFALLFPVFLLILTAIVEFGFMYLSAHTVQHATREGARMAATMDDLLVNDARVVAHTQSFLPAGPFYAGFVGGVTNTNVTDCLVNDRVVVDITGNYNFVALNVIGLNQITLSFPTTMRSEICY